MQDFETISRLRIMAERKRQEELLQAIQRIKAEEESRRKAEEESLRSRRSKLEADEAAWRRKKEQEQQEARAHDSERNAPKSEKHYVDILGLTEAPTIDSIKKKYREQSLKYHPDRVNHLGDKLKKVAEEEMKLINEAYIFLISKYTR